MSDMSLDFLAQLHGTDKALGVHGYTSIYHNYMFGTQLTTSALLEIGLWNGASAKMWHQYFLNANIYMVEYNRDLVSEFEQKYLGNFPRMKLINESQSNPKLWNLVPEKLDYVIDDGSHNIIDQLNSLQYGWHKLKSHGLWIIEDTHTSFNPQYNDGVEHGIYGTINELMIEQQMGGYGYGNFYTSLQNSGYKFKYEISKEIFSIQLFKSLVVLMKA